jgi:uncharacterized membrane protein
MPTHRLPGPAQRNLETVAALEERLRERCTGVDRTGTSIARIFGSFWFIAAHALFVAGWIGVNCIEAAAFDPYPFSFLSLIVGIEFFFLTTFVLMNQHLQATRQEQWAQLSLQLCMLTEQEVTKTIQMLDRICAKLNVTNGQQDRDIEEYAQKTPVEELAREIPNRQA